jgi:hypothetical protein
MAAWALASVWLAVVFTAAATIEKVTTLAPAAPGSSSIPAAPSIERELRVRPPGASGATQAQVPLEGLTEAEVRAQIARGEVNLTKERTSRSVVDILGANIVTRFNALLGSLCLIMLWIGSRQDALFGGILAVNTLIGIVHELRAKRTLDCLVLLGGRTARVVREGVARDLHIAS